MAAYVVMEPPVADATEAAMRAKTVRDGFSVLAFLLPPLWLAWHRLWIEAILALAASFALAALGETAGFAGLGGALSLLVSLFVGLEGQTLRVNALRRRGWHEWGVVEAASADEAGIRYLAGAETHQPLNEPARPATAVQAPRYAAGPALGLFDYPGRR